MSPIEPPDSHYLNAAQGWLELGDEQEANKELERIGPPLRNHPEVLGLRWKILAKAQNWKACVDIGEALVILAPKSPDGWIHRSYALHELKRTEEASDKLEPAADLFTDVWLVRYNLACYACQLGKQDEAREWLEEAFDLAPDKKAVKLIALEDADLEPFWAKIGGI